MIKTIHPLAGALALLTIATFWLSTALAELFASEATTKGTQPVFFIKLTLVLIALFVTSALRRSTFAGAATTERPSPRARRLATASLVLWAAAIVAGRLMAYL